jgi:acyl-CoA thioesterase
MPDPVTNAAKAYLQSCVGRALAASAPPVTRWLGGVVKEVGDGLVKVDYLVRPDMLNPYGWLHGGVQCAMLDDVIGMAISTADMQYVSLNMSVDFMEGVKDAGAVVTVSVEVLRMGRRAANVQATIYDERRNLIARASSNLISTRL